MNRGRRAAARCALAFGGYLLLAVLFTWPLALHPSQHVVGHVEREATPPLNTWAMSVVLHNLPRHPQQLFDGNAFYP